MFPQILMHKLSQQAYLQKLQTKISTGVLPQGEEVRTWHIRDTESMPLDESQKERKLLTLLGIILRKPVPKDCRFHLCNMLEMTKIEGMLVDVRGRRLGKFMKQSFVFNTQRPHKQG